MILENCFLSGTYCQNKQPQSYFQKNKRDHLRSIVTQQLIHKHTFRDLGLIKQSGLSQDRADFIELP